MTLRSQMFRSRDAALCLVVSIAMLAVGSADAFAQACCAGGTVVTPTRLAIHEDVAIGLQLRARSNPGSFDPAGRYTASDGLEQITEQDLAASVRLLERGQIGAVIPTIQTHRSVTGIDDWGGGIGDVSLTARYDFLLAAESLRWPGLGVLAASTLPTGTPPDKATHPLAADATGAGTFDVTLGLDVEKAWRHWYAGVNAWLTHRFTRTVSTGPTSLTEAFSTRWTAIGVASYVFDSEAAAGLYLSVLDEGPATIDGKQDSTTSLRSTTAGAAGVLPIRDVWRIQGSLFFDVPVASFGRNEPAGYGLTASLIRVWL